MSRIKEYIMITLGALAFMLITGTAKSDTHTVTPKQFVETVASVPGKLQDHIQNEWEDIKVYQANSWAEMKFKFKGFKEKFIDNGSDQ